MRVSDQVEELGRQLAAAAAGVRHPEDLLEYMELQRTLATSPRGPEVNGDVFWVMNRGDWNVTVGFVDHGQYSAGAGIPRLLGYPVLVSDEVTEPPYLAQRMTSPATVESPAPGAEEGTG